MLGSSLAQRCLDLLVLGGRERYSRAEAGKGIRWARGCGGRVARSPGRGHTQTHFDTHKHISTQTHFGIYA